MGGPFFRPARANSSVNAGNWGVAREFTVVIEDDGDGDLVASVPWLHGCHTQARSVDRLLERIEGTIPLCPEVQGEEAS